MTKRKLAAAVAGALPPLALTVLALALSNDTLWLAAKYCMILIAPFWVLVVEDGRPKEAGLPAYRWMIRRTLRGMAFFLLYTLVLYCVAVFCGLEPGFGKWAVIAVNGTFLMSVALTWQNMTGKGFAGVLAAAVYCALCAFGGAALGEKMWFVSVSVNMQVYSKILWDNLIYLTALSIILYVCNVMYVGRKENPHRFVMGGMLTALVIVMFINLPQISGYAGEEYKTVTENGYTLHYDRELPESTASDLLRQWKFVQEHFSPYLGAEELSTEASFVRKGEAPPVENGLVFVYDSLEELNPPRYCAGGGSYRKIADTVLSGAGLSTLPEEVKKGWYGYMVHGVLTPSVVELYPPQYLKRYFPACYLPESYEPYLNRIVEQKTPKDRAAYTLYYVETKYGADAVKRIFEAVQDGFSPADAVRSCADAQAAALVS